MSRLDESPIAKREPKEIAIEAILLIPNLVKLLGRIVRDPRVPVRRKTFAGAALIYVISPIDLIPDFVAGLGQLDDLVIVAVALNHLIAGAGRDVVEQHWDGSTDSLDLVLAATEWGTEIIPSPLRRMLPG